MKGQRIISLIYTILLVVSFNVLVEGAIRNCQITESKSVCQTCQANYIPTLDRKLCVRNITNCGFASNSDPKKCGACATGMAFNSSGQCVVVFANCLIINETNPTLCVQCNASYTLTTSRTQCAASIIANCQYLNDANTATCDTCLIGTLIPSKIYCKECSANFIPSYSGEYCDAKLPNCDFT